MSEQFCIDTLEGVNAILKCNTIEYYGSILNIGDHNAHCVQNSSKNQNTFCVKLIKPNLST